MVPFVLVQSGNRGEMGRWGEEGKGRRAWLLYGPCGPQRKKGGGGGGTEASQRRVKVKLKVKVEEIEQLTDPIRETAVTDQCDRLNAFIFYLLLDFQPGG